MALPGDVHHEASTDGGCQCGKIRYAITDEPQLVYACHCTECQRATSSAFSMVGEISLSQAEALTLGSDTVQHNILEEIGRGVPFSADDIKATLVDDRPTVVSAIFPLEQYNGTVTTGRFRKCGGTATPERMSCSDCRASPAPLAA
jgi:hypothetical protein